MKSVGLLIGDKQGEKRRAILPEDVYKTKHPKQLYFEQGYGHSINVEDKDYLAAGANIVSKEECLKQDILVDVKIGDGSYLRDIDEPKILFGWAHAVQSADFTTEVLRGKHTLIAWEKLYREGRYLFYRNREIAGEAAVIHAIPYMGFMPYEAKFAIIGNGMTARGAQKILYGLGAKRVDVFDRKLEELFKKEMFKYDVLINCVLWDTSRKDRLIYRTDLKKFKPGTFILDISIDPELEIETSKPTTIDNPVYVVDGVTHYCVNNVPAMFPLSVSRILSPEISELLSILIENKQLPMLQEATQILEGNILDQEILDYRIANKYPIHV